MFKITMRILMAAGILFAIESCKPSVEQIKASASTIMAINSEIDSVYNLLEASYATYDPKTMDQALEDLKTILSSSDAKLNSMEILQDCQVLKDALCDKIATMQQIAAHESMEQVRIYKLPDESFNDELRSQWDAIALKVEDQINKSNEKVNNVFKQIESAQNK